LNKLKGYSVVLSKTRSGTIGLIILCVSLAFVIGCDPVQRHKVLTFFFDGVPPLGGETEEGAPGEEPSLEELWAGELAERPRTVWFVHEPGKDCNRCHKRLESAQWALPELVKPVPELCYSDCHVDYTKSAALVHGSVVVGECLFCHDPHKSKNEFLLKRSIPDLCYLCHESRYIELIENHSMESYSKCNNCHEPHASSAKGRLKADWKEKAN
jgi:predicted CXXCH cytochrome family protein